MKTETVAFEIPEDLLASLKLGAAELQHDLRLRAAIAYFQDRRLSLGNASQLAGLNRLEFMDALAQRGLTVFDYDESVLASDLAGLRQLDTPALDR